MKNIISISLLSILLLSSCSIDWNDEKAKKISELEKTNIELKKDKIYKKTQDCLKYKNDMLEWGKNGKYGIWSIEQVFYSPKNDSCYFVGTSTRDIDENRTRDFKILFDYFKQEYIIETAITSVSYENMDNDFDIKIKELKGE